jgi:RimJ/RimL family protein N-acetyltransferase
LTNGIKYGKNNYGDIMFETERLIIRKFNEKDLNKFKTLLDIPEVPGWQMQKNRAKDFLQWQISNYNKMDIINDIVCFGIFNKYDKILGAIGAGKHDDLGETEIFYNLLSEERGNGYATEAVKKITEWAIGNYDIPYIIGTTGVENIKSQRILEKCGYKYINEQILLVHIENKEYRFKYYRYYKKN